MNKEKPSLSMGKDRDICPYYVQLGFNFKLHCEVDGNIEHFSHCVQWRGDGAQIGATLTWTDSQP